MDAFVLMAAVSSGALTETQPHLVFSCCVVYEISSQADDAIDIAVTTTTGMIVERRDLPSHVEAEAAAQDFRVMLAAQGLDLIQIGGPALT